ncbi:MAG: DUF192 domain-containing protein [Pseudomonadota bacterium]
MKYLISIFGIVAAAFIMISGCEKMQTEGPATAEDVKGAETAEGSSPAASTAVATVTVGEMPFSVEIAQTDEEKAQGLMDRESLPENAGMWFVFSQPVQEEFWMKDTLMPLDIVFVGEDMKVVHIKENAVPKSVEMISSPVPFMYVLEINAGKVAEHGIEIGDEVKKKIGP